MDQSFAEQFAREWIDAWNSHDLDRVLLHYAEDFEMTSPYIAQITGRPSSRLKGKSAVTKYWQEALRRFPDLHFEMQNALVGVDSVVINYRGANGRHAAEVFHFDSTGKVFAAFAHYSN